MGSPFREVRTVSCLAVLRRLLKTGNGGEFDAKLTELKEKFRRTVDGGSADEFEEILELLLRLELETGKKIIEPDWAAMGEDKKPVFLHSLARNPNTVYFPLLIDKLQDETYGSFAVAGLKKMPETLLLEKKDAWVGFPPREKLRLLREFKDTHPVFTRNESVDLIRAMTESGNGGGNEPARTLGLLHRRGRDLIEAALLVLSDSAPIPQGLCRVAEEEAARFSALYPYLFVLLLDTPGRREKTYPLLQKMVQEQLKDVSLLVLCLSAMGMAKEEDRALACSICRELGERTALAQQNALEFIEAKIGGDAKTFLLLYFETLTPEEKRVRLKPMLKGFPKGYMQVIAEWHDYFSLAQDEIAAEIFGSFAGV
jgi:hypothetical protein